MAASALQRSALESELARLHDSSFGWARSCCDGDSDAAADVLQVAYVKVLSGQAEYAGRSSFRTWFFGVIRFTALESARRDQKTLTLHTILDYPEQTGADETLIEEESVAALRRALTTLPQRQREIIHLVFYEGVSISEAAVIMDVSLGTARVHYDRGKKALRAELWAQFRSDEGSVADGVPQRVFRSAPDARRTHNE